MSDFLCSLVGTNVNQPVSLTLSTLVQYKSTKGVAFVKYVGRAYNNYRNKDGTVSSFGNFKYLCSAHVHRPNEFKLGPNRGFVDTIYITGEETE